MECGEGPRGKKAQRAFGLGIVNRIFTGWKESRLSRLEERILEGHSQSVLSVVFSQNGMKFITRFSDNEVGIWDAGRREAEYAEVRQGSVTSDTPASLRDRWMCSTSTNSRCWMPSAICDLITTDSRAHGDTQTNKHTATHTL